MKGNPKHEGSYDLICFDGFLGTTTAADCRQQLGELGHDNSLLLSSILSNIFVVYFFPRYSSFLPPSLTDGCSQWINSSISNTIIVIVCVAVVVDLSYPFSSSSLLLLFYHYKQQYHLRPMSLEERVDLLFETKSPEHERSVDLTKALLCGNGSLGTTDCSPL